MARLTADDRAAFRRLTEAGWIQSPAERSPQLVEMMIEARVERGQHEIGVSETMRWPRSSRAVGA